MKIEDKIIKLEIGKIKTYPNNTKMHPKKQIKKIANSIKEFGFNVPIILDNDRNIICGHGRYLAAIELSMKVVPCILKTNLTPTQIKALRIADNKVTESDWNTEFLKMELEDLSLDDIDLGLTGFDEDEINELIKDDDLIENVVPEKPEKPKTKYGDIYELGDHYLLCGDSTKDEDVEKLMSNNIADIFITDPPYNVDYVGKTKDRLIIKSDKQTDDGFRKFLKKSFLLADRYLNDGSSFYIWHGTTESYNFVCACKDVGWQIRQMLIWNKNCFVLGRQDYQWKHEPCLYGWKKGKSHNWYSDRKQSTVLDFDKPQKSKEHPTMKPVSLYVYLMQNSSKKGEVVLDLFAGSGTSIIAAEQTNRRCYTMEIDPKYCDVCVTRYVSFTGNKNIKLNGKKIIWQNI